MPRASPHDESRSTTAVHLRISATFRGAGLWHSGQPRVIVSTRHGLTSRRARRVVSFFLLLAAVPFVLPIISLISLATVRRRLRELERRSKPNNKRLRR